MKTKFFKARVLKSKHHSGVALLLSVWLMLLAGTPGSAQLLNQKRITNLQLGQAAEGSRVTIVSDSALNDYEAFRRGDRFYVKIPVAELKSALPHCCANGFEDVQVQRVGDSLVISFRLQPGATARVDQRSNRLDVIFSAPNRGNNSTATSAATRVPTGVNVSRFSTLRGPDAAGPMPPGSTPAFRQRQVTESTRTINESRAPQNQRVQAITQPNGSKQSTSENNQRLSGNNQSDMSNKQSTTGNAATQSPSPVAAASPLLTPSSSANHPALAMATPPAAASSGTATSSSSSSSFLNWRTRGNGILKWIAANRLATLLGALILLSLILYLAMAFSRRRKKSAAAKSLIANKVQPKHSSGADLDELFDAAAAGSPSSNTSNEVARKPVAQSAAASTSQNHSWVLPRPSVASPSAMREGHEEEREVFEL